MNPFIQQLLNVARNTAGRATTAIDVQARRNMGPQIRRVLGHGALNPYSNPIVSAAKKDPSLLTAATKGALVFPGVKPYLGLVGGVVAADAANRTGLTGAIEGGLNQVAPTLDRFFGAVTPRAVQDFGKSMQQFGWGALGGFVPGEISAASVPIKGSAPSLRNYGPGYKEKELAAGAAAERFRPGAGFPGQQGAADRSYQQELSRTAQLTAQDPELQRYETARAAAKTQEEMNSVRDMGLAMWAEKNPKLAAKMQPGQSGFDTIYKQTGQVPTPTFNPLMERTFPSMSRGAGEYTMGPSPLVPQIDQALNPAGPTYALGEGPSLMNFSDENVTPEMIKAFQEQLLKQAASK